VFKSHILKANWHCVYVLYKLQKRDAVQSDGRSQVPQYLFMMLYFVSSAGYCDVYNVLGGGEQTGIQSSDMW
jgi:hypothetical protein